MLKSRRLLGDQGDQGSKGDGTKAKEAVREQAAAVTAAEVAKNGHHYQRDAGAGNGSAGAQQPQAGAAVGQNPGKNSNGAGSGGNNPNRGFLSGGAVGGPTWQEYDRELADLLDDTSFFGDATNASKPLQAQHPAGAAQQVQNREAQGQDPSGANGGLPRAISAPPYMQGLQGGASGQLKGTGLLNLPGGSALAGGVGFVEDGQASSFDASDKSYEDFYKKYGGQQAQGGQPQQARGKANQAYNQYYSAAAAGNQAMMGGKPSSMGGGMMAGFADQVNNLSQLESFYGGQAAGGANPLLNSRSTNSTPMLNSGSNNSLGSLQGAGNGNNGGAQFGGQSRSSTPGMGAGGGAINGAQAAGQQHQQQHQQQPGAQAVFGSLEYQAAYQAALHVMVQQQEQQQTAAGLFPAALLNQQGMGGLGGMAGGNIAHPGALAAARRTACS